MLWARRDFLALAAAAASPPPARAILRVPAWPTAAEDVLATNSLSVSVEGRPSRVLRLSGPRDDLLLMLVLDLTGDLTLVEPARDALAAQIRALPQNGWCGLLRAQDGLRVLADPGPDREATASKLAEVQITGRAGLLDSIEPAAELAAGVMLKSPVRVALLYVTDSNIYNYRADYTNPVINHSDSSDLSRRFPEALIREKAAKLTETLTASPAPLFIVHLVFLRDRLNEAYQTGLQQMSEATGGQAWFSRSVTEIGANIEQAFLRIRRMWVVDVEAPGNLPKSFTVALKNGAELQHRTRYALRKR